MCITFVLSIFYSQLYKNGIEQQAMPMQALSFLHVQGEIFILRTLKIRYMPVFCLFTLGRHGYFTAGVT
jgi:hypothetical protein